MERLNLIMILTILSLVSGVSIAAGESRSSTQSLSQSQHHPAYLSCDETPADLGPNLQGITVGSSSLDDLLAHLAEIGEYRIINRSNSEIIIQRYDMSWGQYIQNPLTTTLFTLRVCVTEENTISAIEVPEPMIPQYYPEYLICDAVLDGLGPAWEGITIGSSSFDDLQAHLTEIGEYQIVWRNGSELTIQRTDITWKQHTESASTSLFKLQVCVTENNTISVIGLPDVWPSKVDLYDLLAVYGMPNAVTWMARPLSREVYWLENGISATIYTGLQGDVRFRVESLYYFPYLNIDEGNFETTWPVAFVREEVGPIPNEAYQERNPFDFEAMIETLTTPPTSAAEANKAE